jgi:hypothetical protein
MVEPVSAPAAHLTPATDAPGPADVDNLVLPAAAPPAPVLYEGPEPTDAEMDLADMRIGPMGVERPKKKSRYRLVPYGPLLVLGIGFFVGGVVWQAMEKDGLGLGMALLGGLLTSVSLYYLLQQIDDDQAKP